MTLTLGKQLATGTNKKSKSLINKANEAYVQDKQNLRIQQYFENCQLDITHKINIGEAVFISFKDLKVSDFYCMNKGNFTKVLEKYGQKFLTWLEQNELTYKLKEHSYAYEAPTYISMEILPKVEEVSITDAAYGGPSLYQHAMD